MKAKQVAFGFWLLGLFCLIAGLVFGFSGSLQYIIPGFLKEQFTFAKMRPLHVFLTTQWISCSAVGSMYYFIPKVSGRKIYSTILCQLHLLIQLSVISIAVVSFFLGKFTGREYMEFPVWLTAFMILGWVFALINFIATIKPVYHKAPVHIWGWTTGIVFFIITLTEASLWQLQYFNGNIIRDITVQWKALGSMVGAWNMLIYGSVMYVMSSITGNDKMVKSKQVFFFYFLGLTNLMFNWGHHTYIVPASPVIKNVAYIISMTELLILFNLIWQWQKSLSKKDKQQHLSYKMLKITDNWIMLNLILALFMSVPALNYFTHGTHITVAHAMGATIGINSTILFATGFYIVSLERNAVVAAISASVKKKFTWFNVSLIIFWISLVGSGITKAIATSSNLPFATMMKKLQPWFHVFSLSGFVLAVCIITIAIPLFKYFIKPVQTVDATISHHNTYTLTETITTEELHEV